MKKKLLLAVDNSAHSKNAIKYAVRASSLITDLSYTLFNVQLPVSQFLEDEAKASLKAKSALEKMKTKNAEDAHTMLEKHKTRMIRMGIKEGRIDIKNQPRKTGIAKDILEHARERCYDAIVVGRRGLSLAQEVFMGSLTNNLAEHSKVIPLWVIDGEVRSEKIMIAIDGSENTLRALDHFSFMAEHHANIKITLFHVVPLLKDFCRIDFGEKDQDIEEMIIKGDKRCVENFLVHAYKKFKAAGIREDQLEIREAKAITNVGKAITEEAEKGDYGTVIVGRRGISKAFFMGSVSKYVLEKTSNRALWLIP